MISGARRFLGQLLFLFCLLPHSRGFAPDDLGNQGVAGIGLGDFCPVRTIVEQYVKYCESTTISVRVKCGLKEWSRAKCESAGCCYDGRVSNQIVHPCFHSSLKNAGRAGLENAKAKKRYSELVKTSTRTVSRGVSIRLDHLAFLFNSMVRIGMYNSPDHVANAMAEFYPETQRSNIRILDVGAGTGLVGKKLGELGFKRVDAAEPSVGRIAIIRNEDDARYENVYKTSFGNGYNPNIEKGSYDSLVCVRRLEVDHIPVEAVEEMIDVVKPGGTLFIVTTYQENPITPAGEYYEKLDAKFNGLVGIGRLNKIESKVLDGCLLERKCKLYAFTTGNVV